MLSADRFLIAVQTSPDHLEHPVQLENPDRLENPEHLEYLCLPWPQSLLSAAFHPGVVRR